jgi:hypothetical protein
MTEGWGQPALSRRVRSESEIRAELARYAKMCKGYHPKILWQLFCHGCTKRSVLQWVLRERETC